MAKITLLDWDRKRFVVDIPDDTEVIRGEIISGDMVMYEPFRFDTGKDTRRINYHDGEFEIFRKDFDKLESMNSSYGVFRIMWNI